MKKFLAALAREKEEEKQDAATYIAKLINVPDEHKYTPLHYAIGPQSYRGFIQLLLEAGAHTLQRGPKGFTAVMKAAYDGDTNIDLLFQFGHGTQRGIDAKDDEGKTALYMAAGSCSYHAFWRKEVVEDIV